MLYLRPMSQNVVKETNNLFPIFLKLEKLRILIVGGGNVGLEKLNAVLGNSPATKVKLVATEISDEIKALVSGLSNIQLVEKPYTTSDLADIDIAITAIDDPVISEQIVMDARVKGILINAADKPELCDFYLSSVVKKGNLKIAISTNGKSPTVGKRLKENFNEMLPEELDEVLDNMHNIRKSLNGNFSEKVHQLNEATKLLSLKQMTLEDTNKPDQKIWMQIVKWCLFAFVFMIVGHAFFSYFPLHRIEAEFDGISKYIDTKTFLLMLLCGFLAQMVDGSLGMGYGTISTTFLLSMGVSPAIVSSRVHSARVFSSGVSGYSHHRFGNINKKLFKALVLPGAIGAIIGAGLAFFGQKYADQVKLPLSIYTCYLGFYIIRKAFNKTKELGKVKNAGWLATIGGFMDAFAGGGWGTLVTSTLISKRKSPRFVIGSVCLAEFFVVFCSSVTFFILLKNIPLLDVLGLIIGGLIAAPIAARLVGKLPTKAMYIAVGSLVILTSLFTLWKAANHLIH